MTKSQLESLRRFDQEWRSIAEMKRRGVDEADIPILIEARLIEVGVCGASAYKITDAGRKKMATGD